MTDTIYELEIRATAKAGHEATAASIKAVLAKAIEFCNEYATEYSSPLQMNQTASIDLDPSKVQDLKTFGENLLTACNTEDIGLSLKIDGWIMGNSN